MENRFSYFTGTLKYKEINFTFKFDGHELHLIPPPTKKREIYGWLMDKDKNGVYFFNGNPVYIDSPYMVGYCNETFHEIVFILQNRDIRSENNILVLDVAAYILYSSNEKEKIRKMSFQGAEINGIYPINQAIEELQTAENGVIQVKTKNFDETKTGKQVFHVNDKEIKIGFSVGRQLRSVFDETPLTLYSLMTFEFEGTDDLTFIFDLYYYAKSFLQYLNYRKNISLTNISLYVPCAFDRSKNIKCAELHICNEKNEIDKDCIKKHRYISQSLVNGFEGKLLDRMVANNIFLRHIPNTYEDGNVIDAARFILIVSAFEWEFDQLFPDGIKKKDTQIKREQRARESIEALIAGSTGKLKEIYKFCLKSIDFHSLQAKIKFACEALNEIIYVFGELLYKYNGETLNYDQMGQRLADQRNHYAHGDLDKDFIGLSALDLIFLERVIYAMQLKTLGIDDKSIQMAINDLFRCHIAL